MKAFRIKNILLLAVVYLSSWSASAQMSNQLYGNEWIDFDKEYFKIEVASDGIYRITQAALSAAGFSTNSVNGSQLRLYWMGQEVPIHVSQDGLMGSNDYIEFFGRQNRSELDRELFANPDDELLNPDYSLFTNTSAYYLSWADSGNGLRYNAISNELNGAPAKETHFKYTLKEVYSTQSNNDKSAHVKRTINRDGGAFSYFDVAEGFSTEFATTMKKTISPAHVFVDGGDSRLQVRFASDNLAHRQTITLNGTQIFDESYIGFTVQDHEFDLNTVDISSQAELEFKGIENDVDRVALASIGLTYPRLFNFDGLASFQFTIESSSGKKYLEIENFDTNGGVVLYDVTNTIRIPATVENGLVKVVLPASTTDRNLMLVGNGGGVVSLTPTKIDFIDYSQDESDYFIISHKSLMDDGSGNNYVQEYANYRATQIGGAYQSKVIDVEQLYEQFAYGIRTHPLSIRNFIHYIDSVMPSPRYIFLIGKGRTYDDIRRPDDKISEGDLPMLVPTYGTPGSDVLLAGDGRNPTPRIPIGRLAARQAKEIEIYLRKVKDFEANVNLPQTIEDRAWMKRIIHLGGGGNPSEQNSIRNNLEGMESIIEANQFGGQVNGFYKNSGDPVQISTSEQIFELINDGLSIITFFGHSGANTFDFNIDNPDNYKNKDKYPMMFSLGCFIGNIHTHFQGVSERFTFDEDAGAIGFGASNGLGFVNALNQYMRLYYNLLGGELYGASIGDIQRETIARQYPTNAGGLKELLQQFGLHADPALRLNPAPGPDYLVDAESVQFEPGVINAQLDEYELSFSVVNIGQGVEDSIVVKIEQEFPDGSTIVSYLEKIKAPIYRTDLKIKTPVYGRTAVGLNKLYITVDLNNEVAELPALVAENNNELQSIAGKGISFYVIDNGILPVYPKEFAIVNQPNLTLVSSTLDALAKEQKFVAELDTTMNFNSPLKKRKEIIQKGGLVKWTLDMDWQEGAVYYWRISPDSADVNTGFVWENSSFIYLPDESEGWNQSHYFQYLNDRFENIDLDSTTREFKFSKDVKDSRMINKVWDSGNPPQYFNNNSPWKSPFSWTINEGIQVIIRDELTLKYWVNPTEGLYNSINEKGRMVAFPYKTNTEEERLDLINFLDDIVPEGHYVILYSVQRSESADYSPEVWDEDLSSHGRSIYKILEDEGASLVRDLESKGSVPYILVYQKGRGIIEERIGENVMDIVTIDVGLPGLLFEGQVNSTIIGPAKKWESLNWALRNSTNTQNDTASIDIYGLDVSNNIDTILFSRIEDKVFDLSQIDANKYPTLRLVINSKDDIDRTTPALQYWRVLYEGLPDAAVNPNASFVFNSDTIQQGDEFNMSYTIENISEHDLDSLLIQYRFQNEFNNTILIDEKIAPLKKWDSTIGTVSLSTKSLNNQQKITVAINPKQEQAESNYLNNFIVTDFFVKADVENPILDVTFDGTHIMDGDIVSPKPIIQISLKDENPFLQLEDTSLFRIYLNFPDGSTQRVNFNNANLNFFPASGNNNKASIEFSPELVLDGRYELLVQAEDATGNQSGDLDYKITFEVINKKMLSNVLNYPNPFSTATQFVYTLTGDEVPSYFKIQIFTVGGRIVKEITQDELGLLKIGTNKSEYSWDGTDDYGSKLANGVYLYRVLAKDASGKKYEQFDNSADKFFQNGFGKLVILR